MHVVASWLEQFSLPPWIVIVCAVAFASRRLLLVIMSGTEGVSAGSGGARFSNWSEMAEQQVADAAPLDRPFEILLREDNLNEQIMLAFRVQAVLDRGLFIALDSSEESFQETAKEAFDIAPTKGFAHKSEMAQVVKAWSIACIQNKTKKKLTRCLGPAENQ